MSAWSRGMIPALGLIGSSVLQGAAGSNPAVDLFCLFHLELRAFCQALSRKNGEFACIGLTVTRPIILPK